MCFVIVFFLSFNNLNLSNILFLAYCMLSILIPSISVPYFINKSLGGLNGDSYGASLVITETINLLLLSIILVPS